MLALVARTRARTGWTIAVILERLGLTRSRYYDWRRRAAEQRLADRELEAVCSWALLPAEKRAVIDYALDHPKDGYRRLAWQMVDADVAYLSPSSVYRVLSDEDLLYRWKRSRGSGEPPPEPSRPNERWHTDIMYLRVADVWYFLVTVLDAYSRYVVHWDLLSSMTANDVRLVVQEAVEHSGEKPRIVTDNGSQFTSRDFKQLVRIFDLEHIRIRTYHPESNGRVERFHRSTREALEGEELENLVRAREIVGRWVEHYNHERLHASLQYLPPAEYYDGEPQKRIAERKDKLETARQQRARINRERQLQQIAAA
ncbi:MAG: IS3 family transposase [Gemmatimonadota bacterium]